MPITLLDIILLAVMLVSGLLAMVRGFMREVLSIDLSTRQTAARSLWAPIGNAFREFLPSLVRASASVIEAVAYLLPWAIVLSIVVALFIKLRRKWRQRKTTP